MEAKLRELSVDSRLSAVEDRVNAFLKSVDELKKTTTIGQRNHERKKLYSDVEYIRLDIEEEILKLHEAPHESPDVTPPSDDITKCEHEAVVAAVKRLDILRNQLALETAPPPTTQVEKVMYVVRFATAIMLMFGGFAIVFFIIPLRWSHLILRKYGIPNNWLPMDLVQHGIGRLICMCAGVKITTDGTEKNLKNLKDPSTVAMFTSVSILFHDCIDIHTDRHGSNLDTPMILAVSPVTVKLIGKKTLFLVPIIGWVFRWGFGLVPIDRSNREKAKKSLKDLAEAVNDYGRSIAISPEGKRTKNGQLCDFKKGPFYLQADVNKPITPVIIQGVYELWSPGRTFAVPGKCLVRFLPQFLVDPKKSKNANRLALRRVFLNALAEPVPDYLSSSVDDRFYMIHVWTMVNIWFFVPSVLSFIASTIQGVGAAFGLSWFASLQAVISIMVLFEGLMWSTC
ncbi:unnamed protein product [Aphanomyces euteiches]|nr:hypothetical protein AeRB84_003637 [Aphanomyces euteiches]